MAGREQRPPRSARPRTSSVPYPPDPAPSSPSALLPSVPYTPAARPPPQTVQTKDGSHAKGISFQDAEQGDRHAPLAASPPPPARGMPSAYNNHSLLAPDAGAAESGGANVGRKKSLVRPEREKIEPGHRQWHYRTHAAQLADDSDGRVGVMPSATGNTPYTHYNGTAGAAAGAVRPDSQLRRGKSILARDEDMHESGLSLFHRSAPSGPNHLRRRRNATHDTLASNDPSDPPPKKRFLKDVPGPQDAWMIYCWFITLLIPNWFLRMIGLRTPEQRRAWREKMGLIAIIASCMAVVGYVTFGFTQTVCGRPPTRFHSGSIDKGSVIIHGYDYDFSQFNHPKTASFSGSTNPQFEGNWDTAGNDISFMFQKVGQKCRGLVTKSAGSKITGSSETPDWYFPCNVYNQYGTSQVNQTNYDADTTCHLSSAARGELGGMRAQGQVYYTWDDVARSDRNLGVFESSVLDFDLLNWLDGSHVSYPGLFDDLRKKNGTWNGKDLSMYFLRTRQQAVGHCLEDLITVGFIDTNTIGCVASEIVLYVSLVFIIGVVGIRFGMAVLFAWFFSSRIGNFNGETYSERMARVSEIENWTNDIYRPAPSKYRPNVGPGGGARKQASKMNFFPSKSRYTPNEVTLPKGSSPGSGAGGGRPGTTYGMLGDRSTVYGSGGAKLTPPESPGGAALFRNSRSSTSLTTEGAACPFPLIGVVPQPAPDFEPYGYPLAHTICLVTAYSESVEGLRTTLDSLATTDYPNSHKLILIIADGMVQGAGNDKTTPDICLGMMKDFVIAPEDVEPHSYVAIADGHKRHNMAKVFAGFYAYDDASVERSKQQRVPIVLVAKVGNPLEQTDAKPGNRGKRDSQIVLMAFLQKVMFDERMTTFEYEFFNSVWRVAGISPDRYELVLCVDADTKVFPDSLSRMVACMVQDEEIMGLCGETKIANKAETWVTMIQVFEYYISHHMTKAFESMFGGVTCLPGCFSMYRIKAPKGDSGYWVPILANPDIVEHYSENVVDTLHKKNLLLLGEDRYLTTLMLKTFPRRKNMFCPSAVCKTVVPDTFSVLLSQRRRWINSTIHNLFELLLVRDLCGTFCFSMQFVIAMELGGTLVLPAAISFTIYLIIISAIPGGSNTTIPLILLAIVLGLPGILIVITTRKFAYVGWMLVYLLSLPIWNGILPAYSFWHFDDFSWGQTRQIAGAKAAEDHGDKVGEFDSSHIVMKRWAEFERERRWKSDTQSRDSTYYDPMRSGSPKRYSLVSSSETTFQQPNRGFDTATQDSSGMTSPASPAARHRYSENSNQLLMLPTPLSVQRPAASAATSTTYSRSSEDGHYMAPTGSHSAQRLVSPVGGGYDDYDARNMVSSPTAYDAPGPARPAPHKQKRASASASQYPAAAPPPADAYRRPISQSTAPAPDGHRGARAASRERRSEDGQRSRGVSLVDAGVAPSTPTADAVRRVPRSSSRRQSQQPAPAQPNRYSRGPASPASTASAGAYGPHSFALPPGASAPQSQYSLPPGAGQPRSYGGGGRYAES